VARTLADSFYRYRFDAQNPLFMKYAVLAFVLISWGTGCRPNNFELDANGQNLVKESVSQMTSKLIADLSQRGPLEWLNYFEKSPDFFMVSDGQLAFEDYQSSELFIENTLVKKFVKINLQLSHLRIDPLTPNLAALGANYHEDLIDSSGKAITANGYLSALAKQTSQGWKFENLHWSTPNKQ
jgi:hypothetical protein